MTSPLDEAKQIAADTIRRLYAGWERNAKKSAINADARDGKDLISAACADDANIKRTDISLIVNPISQMMQSGGEVLGAISSGAHAAHRAVAEAKGRIPALEDSIASTKSAVNEIVRTGGALDTIIEAKVAEGWHSGNIERIENGGKARPNNADDKRAKQIIAERKKRVAEEQSNQAAAEKEAKEAEDAAKKADKADDKARWERFRQALDKAGIDLSDDAQISAPSTKLLLHLIETGSFPSAPLDPEKPIVFSSINAACDEARRRGLLVVPTDLRHDSFMDALEHGGFEVWFDDLKDAHCIRNRFLSSRVFRSEVIHKQTDDGKSLAAAHGHCLKYCVHAKMVKDPATGERTPTLTPIPNNAWGGTVGSLYETLVKNHGDRVAIINPIASFIGPLVKVIEAMSADEREEIEQGLRSMFTEIPGIILDPDRGTEHNREIAECAGYNFGGMLGKRLLQQLRDEPEFERYREIWEDVRPQRETPILVGAPNAGKSTAIRLMMPHIRQIDERLADDYVANIRVDSGTFNKWLTYMDGNILALLDEFEGAGRNPAEVKHLFTEVKDQFDKKYRNAQKVKRSCVFIGAANKYVPPDDTGVMERLSFIFVKQDDPEAANDVRVRQTIRYIKDKRNHWLMGGLSLGLSSLEDGKSIETPKHLTIARRGQQIHTDERLVEETSAADFLIDIALNIDDPRLKSAQGRHHPYIAEAAFWLRMGWLTYPSDPLWVDGSGGVLSRKRGDQMRWDDELMQATMSSESGPAGIGWSIVEGALARAKIGPGGDRLSRRANKVMSAKGWSKEGKREWRRSVKYHTEQVHGWQPKRD